MFVEQLIKKKEKKMISGLWRRRSAFFSLGWLPPFSSLILFIS
jgi:hypothetical protein